MQIPAIPLDESERLRKLEELKLLYSPSEERFDQITRIAKYAFDVQMVLISLVGDTCQWFKSAQGICVPETDRAISFCGHAIHQDDVFLVPDATKDVRFADNPLVTGWPFIRFYAGYPLHVGDGTALGTLCLIDGIPRTLKPNEIELFRSLGSWASFQLSAGFEDPLQTHFLLALDEAQRKDAIDPLTRTWTPNALQQLFAENLRSASDAALPHAMLRIRISNYDDLAGTHNRDRLDYVTWQTCQRLHATLRASDLVARSGDDSFTVVLREARASSMNQLAEEIRKAIEGTPVDLEKDKIEVRVEMASIPVPLEDGPGFDALLDALAIALQKAPSSNGYHEAGRDEI